MAFGAELSNNVLRNIRVSYGSVAPAPLRARHVETFLEGKTLDDAVIAGAVEEALKDVTPIDDVRASSWYRNHLVQVFTRRLLADVADR